MKTTIDRKEIQEKLKLIISKYVSLLIKTDSKKIKKSIKKASRIIAKAIARKIDESDGQITLHKSTDIRKVRSFKPKKASIKKPVKTPAAKGVTAKPVQKTKAKTIPKTLNVSKESESSVIIESN